MNSGGERDGNTPWDEGRARTAAEQPKQPTLIDDAERWRLPAAVLLVLLAVVIVRASWVGDDALISLRVALNGAAGNGLVFNVGERVQAFTHPLWMGVMVLITAVFESPWYPLLVVSWSCALAAVWLLARRVAGGSPWGLTLLALAPLSAAFVDYATSGLENPLSYLLIALFAAAAVRTEATRQGVLAFLCAGLLWACRPDLILLVAPVCGWLWWRLDGWRRRWHALVLAAAVPAAWISCAICYYGFPFPNTAYAKLATELPRGELVRQGVRYVFDSLDRDPLTLLVVVGACLLALARRRPLERAVVLGVASYLAYVVWIGGDFMSGRFFSVPFVVALWLLAREERRSLALAVAAGAWVLALFLPTATLRSGSGQRAWGFDVPGPALIIDGEGIADERAAYHLGRGLLTGNRDRFVDVPVWPQVSGPAKRIDCTCGGLGQRALAAGPAVYLVDPCGLTDPLLARLPVRRDQRWRIGHFERRIPTDYLETREDPDRKLVDPGLERYRRALETITMGPLWRAERWREMWAFWTGQRESWVDRRAYAEVDIRPVLEPTRLLPERMRARATEGVSARSPEVTAIRWAGRLELVPTVVRPGMVVELQADANDRYRVELFAGGRELAQWTREPLPNHSGQYTAQWRLPAPLHGVKVEAIEVWGSGGDWVYAVGRLALVPPGRPPRPRR